MAGDAGLVEALAGWIDRQRWFTGKGSRPRLRIVGALRWHDDDDLRVETLILADDGGDGPVVYQVPVTLHRRASSALQGSYIGSVIDEHGRTWHAYDGAYDPAFTARLLRLVVAGGAVGGDSAQAGGVPASAVPAGVSGLSSRVLSGEQSNTSIIFEGAGGGIICKLFRTLHHGENPDVVLQSALYAAGSPYVPAVVGSLTGRWPDPGRADGCAVGHLAFAQRFLEGAEDAWRRALRAAADGEDFSARARQMGVATADIHLTLATVLPTRATTEADVDETVAGWVERLDAAAAQVPSLEPLRAPILATYRRACEEPWPRMQRIHGDLHLGQILATGDGEWSVIDFEGEPLRPLAARSLPDVPLRDVAGMLRSFDYVAGAERASPAVAAWVRDCRRGFLDGYSGRRGEDLAGRHALLDAFELDKALYEAVYEARNRPAWVDIPAAAVRRLALRDAG